MLPFVLAVVTSFKSLPDFAAHASSLLFDRSLGSPTLDGLRGLDSDRILFWRWLFNSVLVTVCVVVGRVILSALAGYSLARIRFPGYKLVFALILAVMMVPPIVLAIPRFLLLKELGMINTYPGLIVPLMFDAFGIFLMKQFMEQIPVEIEEAAAIDGAGRFSTFTKVVLPERPTGRDHVDDPRHGGLVERVHPPADRGQPERAAHAAGRIWRSCAPASARPSRGTRS